jgi:hypothetical protein
MKLLKILTIVLFSLFLFFSVSFAQENKAAETGVTNLQQNGDSGDVKAVESGKTVTAEIKTETDKTVSDPVDKKKAPVEESKTEIRRNDSKKSPEKKVIPVTVEVKEETVIPVKMEGDLLLINEGNFKYKRIPDIKLVDIKPQTADSNLQAAEVPVAVQNSSTGFLGLSKTTSDVIVKGGVLLLILLIFVLYKSRMSGPGRKSSKKRNVLNSYRK